MSPDCCARYPRPRQELALGSVASAALGKAGGRWAPGWAAGQACAGTLPAEPRLCAPAGAPEGQVQLQHLPPQTHRAPVEQVAPSRRPGLLLSVSEQIRTK